MALNTASRLYCRRLHNVVEGKKASRRELHREGAVHCRVSHAGMGPVSDAHPKKYSCHPARVSDETAHHETNTCTAHAMSSEENITLILIPLSPFHCNFISKLSCIPCSPDGETDAFFLCPRCTRKSSVPETAGRLRTMYEVHWQYQCWGFLWSPMEESSTAAVCGCFCILIFLITQRRRQTLRLSALHC